MKKLLIVTTENTYPYDNLAVEEYLTENAEEGEVTLFLWQNRRTVVIGRNQNARVECNIEKLEGDGGFLVRRLSGGGAVYHDLGNLNFTFCCHKNDYDLDRQLEVIIRAVRSFGIDAEKTGRNDITAGGRKFSGNAFLKLGNKRYHHGTIMLDVDGDALARYLNVDKAKLESKGVKSVRARVVSLCSLVPGIDAQIMKERLAAAASEVYGGCMTEPTASEAPEAQLADAGTPAEPAASAALESQAAGSATEPAASEAPEAKPADADTATTATNEHADAAAQPLEVRTVDAASFVPRAEIEKRSKRFASPEWKYGRNIPFTKRIKDRFPWGGIEIAIQVKAGKINDCEIYSDAMEQDLVQEVAKALIGADYGATGISEAACANIAAALGSTSSATALLKDILSLLRSV